MRKLFNSLKIKQKILLISSLPFLALFAFDSRLLWNSYTSIQQTRQELSMIRVMEGLGELSGDLMAEMSSIYLITRKAATPSEMNLSEQRKRSNSSLEKFLSLQDYLPKYGSTALFFNKLKQLEEIRSNLEGNTLTAKEVEQYLQGFQGELNYALSEITREVDDTKMLRTLTAYIALLNSQNIQERQKQILYAALKGKQLSQQELYLLLQLEAKAAVFRDIYFDMATDKEDEISLPTVENWAADPRQKVVQNLLSNTGKQSFSTDPQLLLDWENEKIAQLQRVGKSLLALLSKEISLQQSETAMRFIAVTLSLICVLVLAMILASKVIHNLVNTLKNQIEALHRCGNEISNSISEASTGTAETATSVTETTTTVEELKQTAELSADKARNVADVSKKATEILSSGEEKLEKTIEGMLNIQQGMGTISESIIKLSEHSQSIGKIIDTVNELAEQSHLLAVNAAIEAAKAGEHGKGFSVVAQEVRSLAEQSKAATVKVRTILNDIQNSTSAAVMATEQGAKAVNSGVEMSKEIGISIQSLSQGIEEVSEASEQISLSSEQQVTAVSQVTIAMSNIQQASEQHVTHMRKIELSIVQMSRASESLQELARKM